MNAEEKQALIEDCQREIAHLNRCILAYPGEPVLKRDLLRNEIALAALTAPPVKRPKNIGPCYASVALSTRDEQWYDAIGEAGYEVQG